MSIMMLNNMNVKPLKRIRVLYVEDDLETREELEILLSDLVGELHVATNGRKGITLYREYRPDIVITDIQMPEMNGLSMAADIRHICPDQAIIILSAYNDTEYLFRALELGIQHYITKPISTERLIKQLLIIAGQLNMAKELRRQRELLEQYKLLMDEKAIVCRFNRQGEIIYVNRRFCQLSGFSSEDVIGKDFRWLCETGKQQDLMTQIEQQLHDYGVWSGILINRTKAGGRYIVDTTMMAVFNGSSQVDENIALMLDITAIYERHQRLALNLEQDLKQQKHLLGEYERALEVGTSLCVIDTNGLIMSVNNNFSASFNCQSDELIGLSFRDMIQECDEFKKQLFSQLHTQGHFSKVLKLILGRHKEKTFSMEFVAIYDFDGSHHSYLALCQDITEAVHLNDEIMETQKEFIYLIGEIVENRSQETGKHLKRVAILSKYLAEKYGKNNKFSEMLKITAPMHDVGKIGIADDILHKPGNLAENEFKTMKNHCEMGFKILKDMDKPLMNMAAIIAHQHHEHFDGSGYPQGLMGNTISLEARIVSLIDVFDALSSKRVYKEPWGDREILDFIMEQKGRQFDPELVDLFVDNFDEILAIRNRFPD